MLEKEETHDPPIQEWNGAAGNNLSQLFERKKNRVKTKMKQRSQIKRIEIEEKKRKQEKLDDCNLYNYDFESR